jgi:hypothetical protein
VIIKYLQDYILIYCIYACLRQNRITISKSVMWMRIRIRMFVGLPDPDPSLFCTDPDPSINKQKKVRTTLISTILWLLFHFFDFLSIKIDVNVPSKSNKQKILKQNVFFVGILSATEEKGEVGSGSTKSVVRIRIRIYDHNTAENHCFFTFSS